MADFEEAGDDDVFRKVRKDFDAKGVTQSDHQIRRTMDELMEKAIDQIKAAAEALLICGGRDRGRRDGDRAPPQRSRSISAARTSTRDSRARRASALVGARLRGFLGFPPRHEVDHHPQRKRHKIRDVRADRRLPLEAEACETPILVHARPTARAPPRSDCAEQPRKPAHRAALVRHVSVAVLGEQRAQRAASWPLSTPPRAGPLRPSAIDMMTPCSVWMSCCVGCMREKMLRRLICMVSRLSGGRKNSTFSSSCSRLSKKASSCWRGAASRLLRHAQTAGAAGRELEPLVGDDHHRLREIERGEGRVDRQA